MQLTILISVFGSLELRQICEAGKKKLGPGCLKGKLE